MQVVSHSRWQGQGSSNSVLQLHLWNKSADWGGSAEVTENCAPCAANGSLHDVSGSKSDARERSNASWKARLGKNKECFPAWILGAFFGWLIWFFSLLGGGRVDCLLGLVWVLFCCCLVFLFSFVDFFVCLFAWKKTFFQVCVLLEPTPPSYFLTQCLLWGRKIRSYLKYITSEWKLVVWNLALHYQIQ